MTDEEIKYHNQLWYYKTYNRLINKCIQMEVEGYPEDMYTERHHILPKSMGGTDNNVNLVQMPIRYHIMAHILLSYAYPNDRSLAYAAGCMTSLGNKFTTAARSMAISKFSTRIIADVREKSIKARIGRFTGENSASWGRKASEETRKKQSLAKKGKYNGKNHPNYGKHWPEEMRNRISKTLRGVAAGGKNPAARKVIDSGNNIFDSIKTAADYYGFNRRTLNRWLKERPEKGFKYYNN